MRSRSRLGKLCLSRLCVKEAQGILTEVKNILGHVPSAILRHSEQGVGRGWESLRFLFFISGWGELIVVRHIFREDVLQGGKHFLRIRIGRKGDEDVSLATMGLEDALNKEKAVQLVNERALLKRLKRAKDGGHHTRAALTSESDGNGSLLVRRRECYWMHNEFFLF